MKETPKIKVLIDDAHQIIVNPERQTLTVTIQSGAKKGAIGGSITGATVLGAEAVGFTGAGAITAFNAQATMASGLYAGGVALMPPVAVGAAVGVMTGVALKYNDNLQDRLEVSDVVDHALNGRSTREVQTWTEWSGLKTIVNPQNETKWKALLASPKLADLDYDDRKKMIDKMPASAGVIDALITQKHFESMIPQHSAVVYCKILQISDKKIRTDRVNFFNNITEIQNWETTQGTDSINLNKFKSALKIALDDKTENSLFPMHAIFTEIKNNSEEAFSKWDFLDSECEELMSKIDQKGILNYKPSRDQSLSEKVLKDFKSDIHDLTKGFFNFYNNGKVVDPKTDPEHTLRQTLSYTQEYHKKIRKTDKRFAKDKTDVQRQINERIEELEIKQEKYPEYMMQKADFDDDKEAFEELYKQSPQMPADKQQLNDNLKSLEEKYSAYSNPPTEIKKLNDDLSRLQTKFEKYESRQPHVSAGINIARFVASNINFIGNQFISDLNPTQTTQASIIGNVASGLFTVATGTSLTDAILSTLDDASINDRKERLRKIFDTSNDIPTVVNTSDDIDSQINALENLPTNPHYQHNHQEIIGKIKTPQKILHEFLDKYDNKDKALLNLSAGGLESLTETILSTAFDQEFSSRENFNLLTKLINKAPKEMFAQGGFFAGEKTAVLTEIMSDLLELGHHKPATEFMQALLPKINIQNYNGANPVQKHIFDNLSKMTELSIDMAQNENMPIQEPLEMLLYQTKKDIYKIAKNNQELNNHPVLNHIDSISGLALQNVHDKDYKIFDDLIDMVRISNKYDKNTHKTISTDTVFGSSASPIMDTLIAHSKTMFGTVPKKKIVKFLKTCKQSDFTKNGILGNSAEQLKDYTKTATPEMQKAILDTHFQGVYNNIFILGFKSLQRNLYGLKHPISDDASFSSLDSNKVKPNMPTNRNTQTPYSNTHSKNMAI